MTADLDLSPEAVERLAEWCSLHDMRATGSRTAATIRALSAELATAREALAEARAAWLAFEGATVSGDHFAAVDRIRSALGLSLATDDEADAIRACADRLVDPEGGA